MNTTVSAELQGLSGPQPMILGDIQLYQIIYSNVLYYPVMYVFPLGTLALLNVRLISSLNAIKRRTSLQPSATSRKPTLSMQRQPRQQADPCGRSRRRRGRRKDDNITVCVVVIVCVFIVCQTPALLNQIFWALFDPTERNCGRFHFYYTQLSDVHATTYTQVSDVHAATYTQLSDLLVVVNSSCNFVVYCLFGRTFRRVFLSTVCCCCSWCGCLGDTASSEQQQQQQHHADELVSEGHSPAATMTTFRRRATTRGVSEANRTPHCNHSRF